MKATSAIAQNATSQYALIEAQWAATQDLVDLPRSTARAVWGRRNTELVRSAVEVRALSSWPELDPVSAAIYNGPENRARVARVLEFIRDGERLVDIGCGNGSLGGHILRRKQLEVYLGIDASSKAIASFRSMANANEITNDSYRLIESMVEQAGERAIPEIDPTLVLLLEMLEHVKDPGLVLRQTAAAVGDQTDLLISVPMLGEIEHEWGHVSVFDRARLERMARDAGLHIHWVEPVMHQWLLMLLSKDPNPRPRIEEIVQRPKQQLADLAAEDQRYYFRNLEISQTTVMSKTSRPLARSDLLLAPNGGSVELHVPSTDDGSVGGVTIYRPGLAVLRVMLSVDDPSAIATTAAEFRANDVTLEQWRIPAKDIARLSQPRTWVFRRGFDHGRPHKNLIAGEPAERLEILFTTKPGAAVNVTFHTAHYLTSIDNPTQPRSPNFIGLGNC